MGQSGARPVQSAGFGGPSAALAVNTLKTNPANVAVFIPDPLLF
jgi:uridine phosphorylase